MHRIDTKTAQKDKFGAGKNGFTRGNPQTGTPATDLDDDYFDMLQEELCSVVEASGASLEKGRHDQLLTALRALLLSRKNPFGDIKSDGTVKTALENLGLGEGSALPVGVPVPWPSATPPTGWLKCNGAAFSAEEFPKLAKAYPTLNLPDLRGEFIRGWDDSRGIDTGRSLLSSQAATFIRTALQDYYGVDLITSVKVGIAFASADKVQTSGIPADSKAGDNSNYVLPSADNSITGTQRIAEDNFYSAWISMRPRNISFNYIVRAA
ncbi:TPA: tail fiber protein [Escherichia coli]|nr:tail fiber protein [Escherichia coli]HCO9265015.1 tail fiber protein [Escherichia coli]HCO9985778.1 tail fiber protein [Escherichia coli]HCP0003500.1 tail fiber protein [Escherichia coli]